MRLRTVLLATLVTFAIAACGGSDGDAASTTVAAETQNTESSAGEPVAEDAVASTEDAVDDAVENAEDFADDLVDSLETAQASSGGGVATLTVGDETWVFESVLCAFGPDEIGQEGAEFVLSSIQDGMQFYVSIDSFGHSVSLNDIKDFANPSVSLGSAFGGGDVIELDGKTFSGSAEFMDDTNDLFDTVPGTFSGTCP